MRKHPLIHQHPTKFGHGWWRAVCCSVALRCSVFLYKLMNTYTYPYIHTKAAIDILCLLLISKSNKSNIATKLVPQGFQTLP